MGCFYKPIFLTSLGEVSFNAKAWSRGSIYVQPPVFPGLAQTRHCLTPSSENALMEKAAAIFLGQVAQVELVAHPGMLPKPTEIF